ncbi:hypothetical protein M407DRAFT_21379 [Tulasnella calospora MUT 4182]|uniref:Uncharacterized protein n=1 Tax=Tulasnella calospora MUT 4182 TaxID=1051891 RepID=A0A0C3M732_9AGAM|nr:hypothetical protein M407DRAFT_21379 [Tulasnella calospora MUT 4182]
MRRTECDTTSRTQAGTGSPQEYESPKTGQSLLEDFTEMTEDMMFLLTGEAGDGADVIAHYNPSRDHAADAIDSERHYWKRLQ